MPHTPDEPTYTAFCGHRRLATGASSEVAAAALEALARGEARVLVFDDRTGEQVELGPPDRAPAIVPRTAAPAKPGRGRPKLGVVAREITLLPSENARKCQEQSANFFCELRCRGLACCRAMPAPLDSTAQL